jgi:outer membrane protein assembly factor BamB
VRKALHLNGRWQLQAKRAIVSSAAVAPNGVVYIGADTALYALNAASGSGGGGGLHSRG